MTNAWIDRLLDLGMPIDAAAWSRVPHSTRIVRSARRGLGYGWSNGNGTGDGFSESYGDGCGCGFGDRQDGRGEGYADDDGDGETPELYARHGFW